MFKVGIIGGSGYTGEELLRMLANHPQLKISEILTRSQVGEAISTIYPNLKDYCDILCQDIAVPKGLENCDIIVTALPHGVSAPFVQHAYRLGKRVIDLGADFRFSDSGTYENWYDVTHPCPDLLKQAVYGLTEITREQIKNAQVIGNPGCYPTCALLSLFPLVKQCMVNEKGMIIDAKSGVTGAGRTPKTENLFCECHDSMKAYGVASHRHQPEIEAQLSIIAGKKVTITFTPHLAPMNRGILATIYVKPNKNISLQELHELYLETYQDEYFIKIMPPGRMPETRFVRGSNFCVIGLAVDDHSDTIIVSGVIDNVVKGASGQAIQNMNLMCGLPERMGLDMPALII